MNRITLTFLGLCLTVFAFGQTKTKNPPKWERVISEMSKAHEGDTITYRSKNRFRTPYLPHENQAFADMIGII